MKKWMKSAKFKFLCGVGMFIGGIIISCSVRFLDTFVGQSLLIFGILFTIASSIYLVKED